MSTMLTGEVLLTELDFVRLSKLRHPQLSARLENADLVPSREVPGDVITMNARIDVVDDSGERQTLTLSYPVNADPGAGRISVCSPLGLGLLGRRAGEEVQWLPPQGQARSLSIRAVLFQPEASGDYTT